MIWNFTRGIDAGEVVYSLNYNILDEDQSGAVNANDARRLFPQGHGDAYGHYLTALKGYYSLLLNSNFDWVPRIEAVTVLGKPVSVDYLDERKFASAAAAVARAGKQIFDLTWRKDYQPGQGNGALDDSGWRVGWTIRGVACERATSGAGAFPERDFTGAAGEMVRDRVKNVRRDDCGGKAR